MGNEQIYYRVLLTKTGLPHQRNLQSTQEVSNSNFEGVIFTACADVSLLLGP